MTELTPIVELMESNELFTWLRDQTLSESRTDEEHELVIAAVEKRYIELMKLRPELITIQENLADAIELAFGEPSETNVALVRSITEKQNLLWREALALETGQ